MCNRFSFMSGSFILIFVYFDGYSRYIIVFIIASSLLFVIGHRYL